MQKTLLFFGFLLFSAGLMAQCSELFFSEYVEGYANNKAIEIYNPTDEAVELSDYSLARFSNGSTSLGSDKIIQLPQATLESNDVFVIVVDLRDTSLWDSQFDKPAWNGYNLVDTLFDIVSGLPLTDSLGNILFGPQYLDGNALFGDVYREEYDLQCKADAFLCPVYDDNNVMYFNGNDAMALIKGTELAPDGSNLLDVIGVIGENPETTIGEPAWVDENGFWVTRDRTLVRLPSIVGGRNAPQDVIFPDGSFIGEEWDSYRKNDFSYLGIHNSVCNSTMQYDRYSCSSGPIASTYEINQVAFKMYPNPNTSGLLTVEAEEPIERVDIYNLLGQQVYRQELGSGSEKVELQIDQLQVGMYLVNLSFEDRKLSIQKLVVE